LAVCSKAPPDLVIRGEKLFANQRTLGPFTPKLCTSLIETKNT
jgi:hypothetical protein